MVINLANGKLLGRLVYQINRPAPKLRHQFFTSFRTQIFITKVIISELGLFIEIPKD